MADAPKNAIISVALINSIEGGVLAGNRTLNNEKLPGAIMIRTSVGIEIDYKGSLEFVPYTNIKNVKIR